MMTFLAVATLLGEAAAAEPTVSDPHSGLALFGYDPVGYFTRATPLAGREELELRTGSTVWRFANIGNRSAFAAHPTRYAPAFGGYDPGDVARGIAVAGHPEVWAIHRGRLFLFRSEQHRARFAARGDALLEEAEAAWPSLALTLPP